MEQKSETRSSLTKVLILLYALPLSIPQTPVHKPQMQWALPPLSLSFCAFEKCCACIFSISLHLFPAIKSELQEREEPYGLAAGITDRKSSDLCHAEGQNN